jgi:hypothetical protein
MSHINWSDSPPFGRRVSLIHTLELLEARRSDPPFGRESRLIVELGTSEAYSPLGLGNALLAFAFYAGRYGARVKSVDIRTVENGRNILREHCPEFAELPEMYLADCFDWIPTLHEPIDLLYVDAGFELDTEGEYGAFARRFADRIPSWYIEMFKLFDPICFRPGALMLFDDTDPITFYGKGMHLIPKLLKEGWRQVNLRGEPVHPMALLEKL